MSARLYAVAYDIPHDNRRTKLANVLKSYGERVQYSVFECWLTPAEASELGQELAECIASDHDSVRIYRVRDSVRCLGVAKATPQLETLVI